MTDQLLNTMSNEEHIQYTSMLLQYIDLLQQTDAMQKQIIVSMSKVHELENHCKETHEVSDKLVKSILEFENKLESSKSAAANPLIPSPIPPMMFPSEDVMNLKQYSEAVVVPAVDTIAKEFGKTVSPQQVFTAEDASNDDAGIAACYEKMIQCKKEEVL